MEKAYDSFTLRLDHFQVLYAAKGWSNNINLVCDGY